MDKDTESKVMEKFFHMGFLPNTPTIIFHIDDIYYIEAKPINPEIIGRRSLLAYQVEISKSTDKGVKLQKTRILTLE